MNDAEAAAWQATSLKPEIVWTVRGLHSERLMPKPLGKVAASETAALFPGNSTKRIANVARSVAPPLGKPMFKFESH